jgi:hypothetical protein
MIQPLILSVVVTVAVTVTVTGSCPGVGMGRMVTRPNGSGVELDAFPPTGVVFDAIGAGDVEMGGGPMDDGVM